MHEFHGDVSVCNVKYFILFAIDWMCELVYMLDRVVWKEPGMEKKQLGKYRLNPDKFKGGVLHIPSLFKF